MSDKCPYCGLQADVWKGLAHQTFKVKFFIDLFTDSDSAPVIASREMELGFVPFPGMMYEDLGRVVKVRWTGQGFGCDIDGRHYRDEWERKEAEKLFREDGWEVTPLF
jgi:hypothetical protein